MRAVHATYVNITQIRHAHHNEATNYLSQSRKECAFSPSLNSMEKTSNETNEYIAHNH